MTGIQPLYARPIDDIVALLPELDEHFWLPFPFPDTPLATIVLRRQPGSRASDIQNQLAVVATRYTAYQPLSDAAEELCAHVQGRMGRVFLARLPAGAEVSGQIEAGIYERAVERFILPISGYATFRFDDEPIFEAPLTSVVSTVTGGGLRYNYEARWAAVDAHRPFLIRERGGQPFVFLVCDTFPEQGELPSGIDDSHLCPRAFG
jgi:hypothetical protein